MWTNFFLKKSFSQIQQFRYQDTTFQILSSRTKVQPFVRYSILIQGCPWPCNSAEVSSWCSRPALRFGENWWFQRNNTWASQNRVGQSVELFQDSLWSSPFILTMREKVCFRPLTLWPSECLVLPCRLIHGQSLILIDLHAQPGVCWGAPKLYCVLPEWLWVVPLYTFIILLVEVNFPKVRRLCNYSMFAYLILEKRRWQSISFSIYSIYPLEFLNWR